jgi:hypothetical protein
MTLNRLASTTQSRPTDAGERVRQTPADRIRRVEAMEVIAGDRQRSLQQEIAEVDPNAVGPFRGGERILQETRVVATQLTLLGSNASGLLKLRALSLARRRIDDKA